MQKRTVGSILITLVILMALMPLSKAITQHYWWDDVYFFENDTPYPHPDTDYYDISRYDDWSIEGIQLCHSQINCITSDFLIQGSIGLFTILGAWIGAKLGGGEVGAVVGGAIGLAFGLIMNVVADDLFVDERGCLWWWISKYFVEFVESNADLLYWLITNNPVQATILICYVWDELGYLRAGLVTFYDAIDAGNPGEYTLSISASDGGFTIPASGTYTYDCGESVEVTAIPLSGKEFLCWTLDYTQYWTNPITVVMDKDYSLMAWFKTGGACPTLFVWNGSSYESEGLLDIHANSDVTVQHGIQNTLALENGVYKLQLRESDNYTSHIDQVKLYAVDYEEEWHLCPLVYAKHDNNYVTWKLLFDDENRIDLTTAQTVNLKFLRSIPYSQTAYFIFEINGYNPKGNGEPR